MVIDHNHHKRTSSSYNDKASKRPKITDERLKMDALAFQTPHPNLEGQSVAYQLPSSSPKPSPGPPSPVPQVRVSKKKESSKRARSRIRPNATSTPVQRRGNITPPSFTLSSADHRLALGKSRDSPRSASRSSRSSRSSKSTASSRASSRERVSRKSRTDRHHPVGRLKHAQSLGALDGDNNAVSLKSAEITKKQRRAAKRDQNQQPVLDSPYVSRASSPVRPDKAKKAHIVTPEVKLKVKRRKQSHILGPPISFPGGETSPAFGLADTHFNANLPPTTTSRKDRNNTIINKDLHRSQILPEVLQDAVANKSKSSSKRKSARGAENQVPGAVADKSTRLERRPSAPSALSPPRSQRPLLQPSRLRRTEDGQISKTSRSSARNNEGDERMDRSENPANVQRPAASMQELHPQDHANNLGHDNRQLNQREPAMPDRTDARTSWMYSRGGVDFNRPPSQIDVSNGMAQAEDTYCSSSDEDESNFFAIDKQNIGMTFGPALSLPGQDFVLDDTFAKGIRGVSTPSHLQNEKSGKARSQNELRRATSSSSLPLQKLTDSPPITKRPGSLNKRPSADNLDIPLRRRLSNRVVVEIIRRPSLTGRKVAEVEDPDGEQDMELTQGMNSEYYYRDESRQQDVAAGSASTSSASLGQEAITWVTDSLISPPTAYIRWKDKKPGSDAREEDQAKAKILLPQQGIVDPESDRSTTPSDSIITSISHESPGAANDTTAVAHAPEADAAEQGDVTVRPSATTKRSRSGTIMPASPGTMSRSGARRTRSGTIIGPIVASAAATAAENGSRIAGGISNLISTVVGAGKTRQTRSGTIVASASINAMPTNVIDSGIGMSVSHNNGRPQNRSRSGSMLRIVPKAIFQPMSIQNNPNAQQSANTVVDPEAVAAVHEVGGFVDSIYVPPSSPDEMDLLFAPLDDIDEEWAVAAEPPSPEAPGRRGKRSNSNSNSSGNSGAGHTHNILDRAAARAASAGRWLKSKSSSTGGRAGKGLRARFEPDDELNPGAGSTGVDGVGISSDDELLLVPGGTAALFA